MMTERIEMALGVAHVSIKPTPFNGAVVSSAAITRSVKSPCDHARRQTDVHGELNRPGVRSAMKEARERNWWTRRGKHADGGQPPAGLFA
jgi:hypothetical protein